MLWALKMPDNWLVSRLTELMSRPEESGASPERSSEPRSIPDESPDKELVSNENALLRAASSTVKRELMSSSLPCFCCSSSKLFPVKTSVSGLAICSFTMSESAASWMSSLVSAAV